MSEVGRQLLHGNGAKENGANRWYDKTLQIIVGESGICGLNYEHSPAEGPAVARLMDVIMEYCQRGVKAPMVANWVPPPIKMTFSLDQETKLAINNVSNYTNDVANDLEVKLFSFDNFGKAVPKAFKMSPDSFVQLALQLAYYRLHNDWAPTYETGTLRRFKLGRTDTIRLPNVDSQRFVLSMLSETASPKGNCR